jgi:peroxiredoxin Q/BCP
MAQLHQDYNQFVKRDAEVIAIGPEGAASFTQWWRENDMPFVGLPDPEHTVSKLYGQQVKIYKMGRMPAQLVVDKKGNIRYKHYGNSMSDIAEDSEILALLDELNREESKIA